MSGNRLLDMYWFVSRRRFPLHAALVHQIVNDGWILRGLAVVILGGQFVVFVFQPVGVAFEGEDVGVVDEPVDHGFDGDSVTEDLGPCGERLVR